MFARTERLLLRPGWQEDAPALAREIGEEAQELLRFLFAIRPGRGREVADNRLLADRPRECRGVFLPAGPQQQSFGTREHVF